MVWVTDTTIKDIIEVRSMVELLRTFKSGEKVIIGTPKMRFAFTLPNAIRSIEQIEERGGNAWSTK